MRDKYFLLNLALTFLLLFFASFLVKEALADFWLYLVLIVSCGFCFSWFIQDRQQQLIRIFITIGTFLSLVWMASSILNSSFLYKDIILICIKGTLILEAILSFNVYWPKYLNYMQALSMPLFMCFPLVLKGYNEASIIAVLGYFICWLAILRVKFYQFLKRPQEEINFRRNYSIILPAAIFMLSLSVSGALFFKFPFTQAIKGGLFPQKIYLEDSRQSIEEEYYDLQEQLQKKITELIPEFGSAQDRYAALGLLSYLIKEASTIMEVEQAEEGLISYLKTPGPGLEKGEGKEVIILLKNFVDTKSILNLKKIEEKAMNTLKENPFNIKARLAILGLIHKIQNSNLRQEALEYEKQLQEVIDNSSLDAFLKKELKELLKQLREWKIFQLKQRSVYSKDMPLATPIPIEKEYLEFPEKYAQIKRPPLNIAKILGAFIRITVKGIFLLVLGIPGLLFALYFLTEQQKNKLVALSGNPREFIVKLYANLREALIIFGLKYSQTLTPLSYAGLVEQEYSIENNLFLRFTEKFEEAKYSKHILLAQDAHLALNDYNGFLKTLFSRQNKFSLVLKYGFLLLCRRPLFI